MARKPRWGLIILGIVIFVVIVGAALIATVVYIGSRQFSLQTETTSDPEGEFAKVQARFEGQQPLIEMRPSSEGGPVVHREPQKPRQGPLSNLHVLAWNAEDKKLVRFTMPFWLVRLSGSKPINIRGDGEEDWLGSANIKVTAEEIERRGPGLIVNLTNARGVRVIVWAE